MAGISSNAFRAGYTDNKIRFQGQEFANNEFSNGFGLETYEFKWRMHDPQIGRFWQIDPLSDEYLHNSTYAFSENKVTSHIELEGLEAVPVSTIIRIGQWFIGKKNQANDAVNAAGRIATGKSKKPSTPGPAAIQNAQASLNELSDLITVSEPAIDVLDQTSKLGTFIPAGEAGIPATIAQRLWKLADSPRGFYIGQMLGENLPLNFPVIDKISNRVVTSIKSMDLTSKTYLQGNNVYNTLKGHIDGLVNFNHKKWGGVNITSHMYDSKALEFAIQPGKMTVEQAEQIGKAMQYAKENNIQFNLRFVE